MLFRTITASTLALLPLTQAAPAPSSTLKTRCTGPDVNDATLNLVESYEGFSSTPYDDQAGNPTIGYGHLCSTSDCSEIPYAIPLSEEDGQSLLASDLAVAQNCITK